MTVLLGRHGKAVAIGEHFGCNLRNALVRVAVLVHLDEVCVLRPTRGIENIRNVVLVRDLADRPQIRHGNRLTANGVIGDAAENKRDIFCADGINQSLQLVKIHVALEGVFLVFAALGDFIQQGLVVQVAGNRTHLLNIALGGVKVTV